ncbi:hypothetical protein J6590_004448 [Homalodisca vitripennis]|nr:hypothetical protein J6590_004448 [Homalodisca vitripennis]
MTDAARRPHQARHNSNSTLTVTVRARCGTTVWCRYKDNMARLSHLYRDQPTSPTDRLVF